MDFLNLTFDPLSLDDAKNQVADPTCGAISFFVGTTRDNFEGQSVCRLEYEGYDEMAKKEMKKLCEETRKKWNVKNIGIYHRLGVVAIKEASVVIAVSSEHRRESLDAVSFLIDSLKASVPIWKREIYEDEKSEWKRNKECLWMKNKPSLDSNKNIKEESAMDIDIPITKIKSEPAEEISENKNIYTEDKKTNLIDSSFVQIVASKEDIQRRIQAFQERKREELNIINIQEFCIRGEDEDEENSCARTTAVVLRSKGSSTHLKLTKVVNEWGPQTEGVDPGSVTAAPTPTKDTISVPANSVNLNNNHTATTDRQNSVSTHSKMKKEKLPNGIEERILNMEEYLNLHSQERVHPSVYARLKALEDKILYLESVSPEYFNTKSLRLPHFLSVPQFKTGEKRSSEDDLSLDEMDLNFFALKKKLRNNQLGIDL